MDKRTERVGRTEHEELDFDGCLLVVVDGVDAGRSFRVDGERALVGSDDSCDLVLTDSTVSRRHAEFVVQPDGLAVVDQGSTNGTNYLGQRVDRILLKTGARLQLGTCTIDVIPRVDSNAMPVSERDSYGDLFGGSMAMRRVYSLLELLEGSDTSVLIEGQTGTGKDLAARAIHAHGLRSNAKLVVIDCANISSNLIESELFGHLKGAFTGATGDRAGAFENANGGTVFLDEIGELPLDLQPKLLRVLESRSVKRLGAADYKPVNVRVLAATNRDLRQEVAGGRFREDLFFRLAVIRLILPPLRERREDIPLLCRRLAAEEGGGELPPSARDFMMRYDWPGNVRELRNVVQGILTFGSHALPPEVSGAGASAPASTSADESYRDARDRIIREFESAYLIDLMQQHQGNMSAAARAAGIDRSHLRYLLKKHGVNK